VLSGSLLVAVTSCGDSGFGDSRPNVLLITIDTLRADYLGSYGFALDTSPNIDALAEQSVVFERAIAAATRTAPSHASIMTSRYTREHSIGYRNGDSELTDEIRLAERFRAAGYATAAFVGNIVLRRESGLDRGFDVYDDELPSQEAHRDVVFERIAEQTNRRALDWLGDVDSGPFFLWVHYQDPHGPYTPPEPYAGRFQVPGKPDEQPLEVAPGPGGWNTIPGYQALDGLSLPSEYMSRYADEIFYTDRAVGELLSAVDGHPSRREAIVLLTSDHGESLGETDRYFTHGFATTPQLAHVPLILRAPALAPARRREPVSHVDIMPTLLELAGLEVPEVQSGIAMGSFLREGRALPDRVVYCDIGSEVAAYGSESFVRALGVSSAWKEGAGDMKPGWLNFTWEGDESWTLVEATGEPRAEIHAYVNRAVPMKVLPKLSAEEIKLLSILGYVDEEASD
jgi:arylsulfatase